MKTRNLIYSFAIITTMLLLVACPRKSEPDLKFTEISLVEVDTTAVLDTNSLGAKNVSGYAAKYWRKIFKHCMQSNLLSKKDADYLGPSNTLGLGTITNENLDISYRVMSVRLQTKLDFC